MEQTNFSTSVEPKIGSAATSRLSAPLRRGISDQILLFRRRFGTFRAVLRTALLAVGNARGIKRAAHHVIPNAGKILHTAATDQHDRVLLQVVTDARDVSGHFDAVCQPDAGDLPKRRVRLLRRRGVHTRADAALLRAALQCRAGSLP